MKRHILLLFVLLCWVWMMAGCGAGNDGGDTGQDEPAVQEMQEDQTETGTIRSTGEVDRYHFRAVDTNAIMEVTLTSQHYNADVEFLVTVYEDIGNGNLRRLYADHSPENGSLPANVRMRVFINQPKDIYIYVRDLLDDESGNIPYFLTVNMIQMPEENNSFANASQLTVDSGTPESNSIGYIGDKDCYTFDVTTDGVYEVEAVYSRWASSDQVQLAVQLFDQNGGLIQRLSNLSGDQYEILSYLTVANSPYYVVVEDAGSDDYDLSSSFTVQVSSVNAAEAFTNDDILSPTAMAYEASSQTFSVSGDLEYGSSSTASGTAGDQDWYAVPVDSVTIAEQFKTLMVTFDDGTAFGNNARYSLTVQDANGTILLSHDFAGGSQPYVSQIESGTGTHYAKVSVHPERPITAAAPYDLTIAVVGVDDADEAGNGNNTESNAVVLTDGVAANGKICYRGDVDWYRIDVDATTPKILSLDFLGLQSDVDYSVSLVRGTNTVKREYDTNGSDGDTVLSTGIYVPADGGTVTYHIKVADFQNDDGADPGYSLTATTNAIPGTVPDFAGQPTLYSDETAEQDVNPSSPSAGWTYAQLEIFSLPEMQPEFAANTTFLDFRTTPSPNGAVITANQDGTTTIEFPWIAGFVDYKGDVDLFQLDLGTLNPSAPDAAFHYTIETRMVVAAGSDVEYVWKLYRDRNGNGIIMDDPTSPDGYFAINGDTTPEATAGIDVSDPQGSEQFWVGRQWGEGDAQFFFGISDFNYQQVPSTGLANTVPDADWGSDGSVPPYYLKVILTYHPGADRPAQ